VAHVILGERAGKDGWLTPCTSAAVFDESRERILLIRQADNGKWAVPGGYMEPGESLTEACAREVREETGLRVDVGRLIAVYSDPNRLLVYPDGNRWQLVILHFEARRVGGNLTPSDESSEVAYLSQAETAGLEMSSFDRLRIDDAFAGRPNTKVQGSF
jgi:ADP-ribose pyrophosphatase YjhB (NUDIX family)